jgi:hypothetical protein
MKTWKAVEKEVARRKKGRTRAGSGNQPAYKGDVITEDELIEVKHREFRYSVTLAELHKIERESILDSGRRASFVIHLGAKASKQSYFELELQDPGLIDNLFLTEKIKVVPWPEGRKSWPLDWGLLESLYTFDVVYFYIPAWGKEGRYNLWEFKKLENKIGNARPKQRLTISSC